ncbi:reverse transcriptase [Corchorus capsularis]|uniref:Reverse transcriptase n=1 Tax=Corchorus capsularis TaxID=210143 RepID=A0A1R3JML7_COCAP|nr:reverse transcriptase [Corchorus capsularis]
MYSDHGPMILQMDRPQRYNRRPYRFEAMWVTHPQCRKIISKAWSNVFKGSSAYILVQKLKTTKHDLCRWNKTVFGDLQRRRQQLKNKLTKTQKEMHTIESFRQEKEVRQQLELLYEQEQIFWMQKSRTNWIIHGDINTKFYHTTTARRRLRNKITFVVDEQGYQCEETEQIESAFLNAYEDLFCAEDNVDISEIGREIKDLKVPILTEENQRLLDKPFTADEIKQAAFQLGPWKAPGVDGKPVLFYQQFWDIVGALTTASSLSFLNSGHMLKELNKTLITLVPKKNDPQKVGDFRPISLCNVAYKIIARTMVNRLKPIMDAITTPFQSAFVKGRLISDNIIVGREVLTTIQRQRKGKGMLRALKIDMNKAYDRGGRLTLINSTLQSIPNYTLSCFKAPVNICNKIDRVIRSFWWGHKPDEKKLHMKNWDLICKPKWQGGLGIRKTAHMNGALLGKQAWRILTEPEALSTKILVPKYCKKEDFTAVKPKAGDNWFWKSILAGRDICMKGVDIQIWDGKDTVIKNGRLAPRLDHTTVSNDHLQACKIMCPIRNQWVNWLANIVLQPEDQAKLKSRIFSIMEGNDKIVWKFDTKGRFTVKSAYLQILKEEHGDLQSTTQIQIWKNLWKLKIPYKSPETLEHLFWQCDFARATWFASDLTIRTDAFIDVNFTEWVKVWLLNDNTISDNNSDFSSKFAFLTWNIWRARNEAIFEGKKPHPMIVVCRSRTQIANKVEAYAIHREEEKIRMRKPIAQLNQLTNGGGTEISESIGNLTENDWIIFVETTQKRGSAGFGCCAMARNRDGDTHIVCRTFEVEKGIDAMLLILRSILVRLKIYEKADFGVKKAMGSGEEYCRGKQL